MVQNNLMECVNDIQHRSYTNMEKALNKGLQNIGVNVVYNNLDTNVVKFALLTFGDIGKNGKELIETVNEIFCIPKLSDVKSYDMMYVLYLQLRINNKLNIYDINSTNKWYEFWEKIDNDNYDSFGYKLQKGLTIRLLKEISWIMCTDTQEDPNIAFGSAIISAFRDVNACCETYSMRLMRMKTELNPIVWLAGLIIALGSFATMCSFLECRCKSSEYGMHLEKLKNQMLEKLDNIDVDELKFGKYGQCNGAVSHTWGDELLLDYETLLLCNNMIDNGKKLWLDIIQTEKFDAESCRVEYESDVYIIVKLTWELCHLFDKNGLIELLLFTDWASRGWVSQEITTAKDIHIMTKHGNIHINKKEIIKNKYFSKWFGIINKDIPDATRFAYLSQRIWRFDEDILKTASWWSDNLKLEIDKFLPRWLTMAILHARDRSSQTRSGYCWVPTSVYVRATTDIEARYIGSGIIALEGTLFKISVDNLLTYEHLNCDDKCSSTNIHISNDNKGLDKYLVGFKSQSRTLKAEIGEHDKHNGGRDVFSIYIVQGQKELLVNHLEEMYGDLDFNEDIKQQINKWHKIDKILLAGLN